MGISLEPKPLPLAKDKTGLYRIAETRVTLDSVLFAFKNGATTEEIAMQYPTVELSDLYAVIGFYLKNKKAVDAYLIENEKDAKATQQKIQKKFPPAGIRERLLKKRQSV